MSIIYTVFAFIVAIAVLVVVHEFGHYWVAKRLGVKVLRFSVGFGKPLWSRRYGKDKTEWVIAALPLGGYVKMLDENEGKVPKKDLPRAFNRQPLLKRAAIVLAGPLFNFLLAIVIYWALFSVGMQGLKPVVGKVAENSIAERAGFQAGDELLSIDGKPVLSWDQRRLYLFQRAMDKASVEIQVRDTSGQLLVRSMDLSGISVRRLSGGLLEKELGLYGYRPEVPPIMGSVEVNGPAAKAGIQVGDRIVAIDGRQIQRWDELVPLINTNPGRPLAMTVERAGQLLTLNVTPDAHEENSKQVGKIGIGVQAPSLPPEMFVQVRMNPLSAVAESVESVWLMSSLTLEMLYKMIKLEVSTKTISGPITIAQYAGYSAQIGLAQFLMFLAVVSVSLGVLNLLPIPVLDGGHLLIFIGEAIKGGPLPDRVMILGQQAGIALLLCLMALAFYNDFVRILQ